jgi:hypothetical protein
MLFPKLGHVKSDATCMFHFLRLVRVKYSKDCYGIGRTSNTVLDHQWTATKEKVPPVLALALFGYLVKTQHLADHHTPA